MDDCDSVNYVQVLMCDALARWTDACEEKGIAHLCCLAMPPQKRALQYSNLRDSFPAWGSRLPAENRWTEVDGPITFVCSSCRAEAQLLVGVQQPYGRCTVLYL